MQPKGFMTLSVAFPSRCCTRAADSTQTFNLFKAKSNSPIIDKHEKELNFENYANYAFDFKNNKDCSDKDIPHSNTCKFLYDMALSKNNSDLEKSEHQEKSENKEKRIKINNLSMLCCRPTQ